MNSTIIHDPTFPHGGKYGYILGCSGSRPVNRRAIAAVRLRLGLAPNPAPVNIAGAFDLHQEVT